MRIGKSLWPALLLGLLLLGIAALNSMRADAQPAWGFERRSLVDATKAEIEQAALEWTLAKFQILSGTPAVLLSGAVTREQLPSLGLSPIDSPANFPPLYLVFIKGDFNVRNMPGTIIGNAPSPATYIVYVFDLIAGAPMLTETSLERGHLSKLLNDPPALPDKPLPGESDPNKLPYGSMAPPWVGPSDGP